MAILRHRPANSSIVFIDHCINFVTCRYLEAFVNTGMTFHYKCLASSYVKCLRWPIERIHGDACESDVPWSHWQSDTDSWWRNQHSVSVMAVHCVSEEWRPLIWILPWVLFRIHTVPGWYPVIFWFYPPPTSPSTAREILATPVPIKLNKGSQKKQQKPDTGQNDLFNGKRCCIEDVDIADVCGMSDGGQYNILHPTA